jgi:hypothetical protein
LPLGIVGAWLISRKRPIVAELPLDVTVATGYTRKHLGIGKWPRKAEPAPN